LIKAKLKALIEQLKAEIAAIKLETKKLEDQYGLK